MNHGMGYASREIALFDSIASAVAAEDYISINIPYIKGDGLLGWSLNLL